MAIGAPAKAADPLGPLDYAKSLMAEEDWYRAITELKRYRYFGGNGGDALVPEVNRLIGLCYLHGKQHFDAYRTFGRVVEDPAASDALRQSAAWRQIQAAHLGGASLLVTKDGPSLILRQSGTPAAPAIGYVHAYTLLQLGRWSDSAAAFVAVAAADPDGTLGRNAALLAAELAGAPRLQAKSPALAGVLAVLPGLGHVYAERYQDALNAFYPSAVLGTATGVTGWYAHRDELSYAWPALVGTLALTFYAANIYSAVNVTRQANQLIVENEVAAYRRLSQMQALEQLDYEPRGAGQTGP